MTRKNDETRALWTGRAEVRGQQGHLRMSSTRYGLAIASRLLPTCAFLSGEPVHGAASRSAAHPFEARYHARTGAHGLRLRMTGREAGLRASHSHPGMAESTPHAAPADDAKNW
jgi:hypothetical protein